MEGASVLRRCPICDQEPEIEVVRQWRYAEITIPPSYEFRCHGNVANGDTPEQAVKHWNIFVNSEIERTRVNVAFEQANHANCKCHYCNGFTQGIVHAIPTRYYIDCKTCGLVKYERKDSGAA